MSINTQSNIHRRLIGASRDGTIFEIDFQHKQHLGVIGSGGGAIFCLASLCYRTSTHKSNEDFDCSGYIAAGCEDGCVRIYKAGTPSSENSTSTLSLVSTLPSTGHPIISLAWKAGPTKNQSGGGIVGSTIYAGVTDGTIRRFDCLSNLQSAKESGTIVRDEYTLANTNTDIPLPNQWKSSIRMTVESGGRSNPTRIWVLKALDDGTIVSGDSLGNIQIWDATLGTLLESFRHNENKADVLDIVVSEDQCKIMACGVDPRIIFIERYSNTVNKWTITNQKRAHTHDVNTLAVIRKTDFMGRENNHIHKEKKKYGKEKKKSVEFLCSAGVNTNICVYDLENMNKNRPKFVYRWPQIAPISMANEARILSFMRSDKVDLYHIFHKNTSIPDDDARALTLDEQRIQIGSIDISSDHNLVCSDINANGSLLAISDGANLMIFSIKYSEQISKNGSTKIKIPIPTRIRVEDSLNSPCTSLKFYPHSNDLLACATTSGKINILKIVANGSNDIDSNEMSAVSLQHSFDNMYMDYQKDSSLLRFPINQLSISADGKWLAAGLNDEEFGSIQVFSLHTTHAHWWSLPSFDAPFTCLEFLGGKEICQALVVTLGNNSFYSFDVENKCLTEWSRDLGFPAREKLPKELYSRQQNPARLAYNPVAPNKFLMGAEDWFCSIDLDSPIPPVATPYPSKHLAAKGFGTRNSSAKSKKSGTLSKESKDATNEHNGQTKTSENFTICLKYSNMIFMKFLDDNELVIVEQPWNDIVNSLTDALEYKRYGT